MDIYLGHLLEHLGILVVYSTKETFFSNSRNKTSFIHVLADNLTRENISTLCCRDDADTEIVKQCLQLAEGGSVLLRAEDADILLMLTHHFIMTKHNTIVFSTSNGSYSINELVQSLTRVQRNCLLFAHAFSGCDTVSAIRGFSKEAIFKTLCTESLKPRIDVFYSDESGHSQIEDAGVEIFQIIYKFPSTPLSSQRVTRFNNQCKAGVLVPANYPPTVGAAKQHALRAYLQLQDWLVLKSMSRDPRQYGWLISTNGQYEPVLTLKPVAPENMLKLVSCNCGGDCSTKRCSCRRNNLKCISSCGNCHGNQCTNVIVDNDLDTN